MTVGRIICRLLARSANHAGTHRHLSHPDEMLAERWTELGGVEVFYRETPSPVDAPVLVHPHGFGLPAATCCPRRGRRPTSSIPWSRTCPASARSGNADSALGVREPAQATAAFLPDRGISRVRLAGNSMGCSVLGVAVPDCLRFGMPNTWRMFPALTRYPTREKLLSIPVPTLGVVGSRDPQLPPAPEFRETAEGFEGRTRVVVVVIEGAAHAINFSHPGELSNMIRQSMAAEPIVDDPHPPGYAHVCAVDPEPEALLARTGSEGDDRDHDQQH